MCYVDGDMETNEMDIRSGKFKRVEVQGDNVTKIRAVLEAEGFEVAGVK